MDTEFALVFFAGVPGILRVLAGFVLLAASTVVAVGGGAIAAAILISHGATQAVR